jgi:hypothetical protein
VVRIGACPWRLYAALGEPLQPPPIDSERGPTHWEEDAESARSRYEDTMTPHMSRI